MKRIFDKKLRKKYQGMPCLICETTETTVGHHIKTVGAGGHDKSYNLVPLCYIHHAEIHKGLNRFVDKYVEMKVFLEQNEWSFCRFSFKWLYSGIE